MWYGTLALAVSVPGASSADFELDRPDWHALATFAAIAARAGVPLEAADRLDVEALDERTALVLVHPTRPLPLDSLGAFLRRGGRVLLADDFGAGAALLERYGIARLAAPDAAPVVRGNAALPLATPRARHALTAGVDVVVANHPSAVAHVRLEPLLAFDDTRSLLLTGAVGAGRLVALSDPSVLIDDMLAFEGNARLAENLLRYLVDGGADRVVVLHDGFVLEGRGAADGPLGAMGAWVAGLAQAEAPPAAVWIGAGVVLALLLVAAATSLPRRSPYRADTMFAAPSSSGGFEGRVALHREGRTAPLSAVLYFKAELEHAILRRLGLGGRHLLRDVVEAARASGRLTEPEVARLRALLVELEALRQREDLPESPPRLAKTRFRAMVGTGRALLARLDPPPRA